MDAYFQYLRELLIRFFGDLGTFFYKVFAKPWEDVPGNFGYYHSLLAQYSADFGFWGWFFWVLFLIFLIALLSAIVFGIVILLRRYIRFVKREIDKDGLREEIYRLNNELYRSVQERDKILNLKTGYMGLAPDQNAAAAPGAALASTEAATPSEINNSRFPKLATVDTKYKDRDMTLFRKEGLSLEELCNAFRNYAASRLQLYYKIDAIRHLFAGIGTSKLIILEGISGTGKTSITTALGRFLSNPSTLVPVQPSWKDRSELLGYYNEFTKKFNESEFLRALYEATYRQDLNIIVLDEMNLARIEYYFAEFLSIMEMTQTEDWVIELVPSQMPGDPAHFHEGKLVIPQNVMFFGTANNDDSTFTIADKVYDRAISIFFDDKGRPFDAVDTDPMIIPYTQLRGLFDDAIKQYPVSESMLDKFDKLDNFVIRHFRLAFGNRIMKQLTTFIPIFVGCGGSEIDGFDFIFTNKVLKKFEALNLAFLKDQLKELDGFLDKMYGKNTFPMAHAAIDNFLRSN